MAEEREPVAIRWLDLCEIGAVDFALMSLLLGGLAGVPGLRAGDADVFKAAAEQSARVVMQELGRRAYDVAQGEADDRWREIVDAAMARAADRKAALPMDPA